MKEIVLSLLRKTRRECRLVAFGIYRALKTLKLKDNCVTHATRKQLELHAGKS